MKKVITLTMLALFVAVLSSCGKYDEGPEFSVIPKYMRVANVWKISNYTVNGIDQSTTPFANSTYEFTTKYKYIEKWTSGALSLQSEGTWTFSGNKEKISTTVVNGLSGVSTTTEYDIIMLYNNEMKLSRTENTVTTVIDFTPA
jgi:hypothetical protein